MKLASKPQARELVIKHCLPAQIQCNFSDQASRSRAPTCFPATHCLVLQTTFSPQYWTKHPCSVGSGESVAIDLLHSLVGKCWEGISWLPWGEKSYMRSILKVFQVTGKPDCLEGNNQKSIRMSARHLVIIISFFFFLLHYCSHTSSLHDRTLYGRHGNWELESQPHFCSSLAIWLEARYS